MRPKALPLVMAMALSGCGPDADRSSADTGRAGADMGGAGADAGRAGADTGSADAGAVVGPGTPGPGEYRHDYQTSEAFFTRMHTTQPSSIHSNIRIWYSTNVEDLPLTGPLEVPVGTVAIKPEYDNAGTNFVTVVMIKREAGYDPAHHDWYYEARQPDGSLARDPVPGPAALCISCHSRGEQTDYLLGFEISN